jgi:hypothetical protein
VVASDSHHRSLRRFETQTGVRHEAVAGRPAQRFRPAEGGSGTGGVDTVERGSGEAGTDRGPNGENVGLSEAYSAAFGQLTAQLGDLGSDLGSEVGNGKLSEGDSADAYNVDSEAIDIEIRLYSGDVTAGEAPDLLRALKYQLSLLAGYIAEGNGTLDECIARGSCINPSNSGNGDYCHGTSCAGRGSGTASRRLLRPSAPAPTRGDPEPYPSARDMHRRLRYPGHAAEHSHPTRLRLRPANCGEFGEPTPPNAAGRACPCARDDRFAVR